MADKAVFEPMDLMQGKALTVFDDAHDHATARSSKIDCRSAAFLKTMFNLFHFNFPSSRLLPAGSITSLV